MSRDKLSILSILFEHEYKLNRESQKAGGVGIKLRAKKTSDTPDIEGFFLCDCINLKVS